MSKRRRPFYTLANEKTIKKVHYLERMYNYNGASYLKLDRMHKILNNICVICKVKFFRFLIIIGM